MVNWFFCLQDYVTSDLMNFCIVEVSAKNIDQLGATNIARDFMRKRGLRHEPDATESVLAWADRRRIL
jgi:hypothetical protein